MLVSEAVDFVLQAVDQVTDDLHIPAKLPAYRVADLAHAMRAEHMQIMGLPRWEKKHEGMADGNTSDKAKRMTVEELRKALESV